MWLLYAFLSALFAGLTSILAKCGIKKTDSGVATAIRTIVVLVFSWIMVFIVGAQGEIGSITMKTWIFLILSGLATGASWLCYFRALQIGDVNKVVPIDKSSTILSILLAVILFRESISIQKMIFVIMIAVGTFLMITKKKAAIQKKTERKTKWQGGWLVYAVLSAVFASLTSILGKIGVEGIHSNLGTAIRTVVVLIMAWVVVFVTGKQETVKNIEKKEMGFICLSGLATGASWLCYYKALKDGVASVVISVDKLSMLIAIAFSYLVFKEKLTGKALVGLALITAGTLLMVVFP
jgi:transporter family protein